jgi:predicted nuclease with TOPRIM domain
MRRMDDEAVELDRAAARLIEAVEAIEAALDTSDRGDGPLRTLMDRLHYLETERARLLAELEELRAREQKLEAANDEVSERLEALSRPLRPEATVDS